MADEYRVEVELADADAEHEMSLWDRVHSLDLDNHARERLGGRVTITRDGAQMFMYASTERDAREAEKTVRELVTEDELSATYTLRRWDAGVQEWAGLDGTPDPDSEDDEPVGIPDPRFELLETYKPEFLRDLGL